MQTSDLTRKLGIAHQQWLSHELLLVQKKLRAHEKELMLLTLVIVSVALGSCYVEHRLNKMEEQYALANPAPRYVRLHGEAR